MRGLRAVSDFEFELQMALMNRRLGPDIETVFMMPAEQYTYVSSRLIKEVFALGGPITGLVPGGRGAAPAGEAGEELGYIRAGCPRGPGAARPRRHTHRQESS